MISKSEVIKAYVRIRQIDHTIPDEVLDFMKNTAITEIEKYENIKIDNPQKYYYE